MIYRFYSLIPPKKFEESEECGSLTHHKHDITINP